MDCYDPSTGEVIAQAPQCTPTRSNEAVAAAAAAFPAWADTPPSKRVQVLFRMKALLDKHLDELTHLVATEHGKVLDEAMGDVVKVTELVEFACGIPHLMKGPALMNVTAGYDTTQYMEPLGVFAGIVPWNFPAMLPMGWVAPLCIATGNTLVLKLASFVPQSAMRIMELWEEAGLPKGVINLVTCSRNEAEILLRHPDVKGVSFVGSTSDRQAHLRHRRGQRQARAGAHRGEEPRPGAAGRRPGADGAGHRELGLRLRGRALHGPARGRRGGGDRGQARRAARRSDEGAEDRPRVRQGEPARAPGERGAPAVGDQLDPEGRRRGREARAGRPQGLREGLREGLLPRAHALRPREARA